MTHPLSMEPNDDWICDLWWGEPDEDEEDEEEDEDEEAEERKAVKIGMILQSYGTRRDETKERRDGWNCT